MVSKALSGARFGRETCVASLVGRSTVLALFKPPMCLSVSSLLVETVGVTSAGLELPGQSVFPPATEIGSPEVGVSSFGISSQALWLSSLCTSSRANLSISEIG